MNDLLEQEHQRMKAAPCVTPVWIEGFEYDKDGTGFPSWKCNLHAVHVYVKAENGGYTGWTNANAMLNGCDNPRAGRVYPTLEKAQLEALRLARLIVNKTVDQLALILPSDEELLKRD